MASSLLRSCFRPPTQTNGGVNPRRGGTPSDTFRDEKKSNAETGNSRGGEPHSPHRGGSTGSDEASGGKNRSEHTRSLRVNQTDAHSPNVMEIEVEGAEGGDTSPRLGSKPQKQGSKKGQALSSADLNNTPASSAASADAPRTPKSHTMNEASSTSPKIGIKYMAGQRVSSASLHESSGGASPNPSSPLQRILRVASSAAMARSSMSDSNANSSPIRTSFRLRGSKEDPIITGRSLFSTFLKRCYSHEVLDYWEMTSQYIKLCKKRGVPEQAIEMARAMVEEYVLPDAPQKLDLGEPVEDPLGQAYSLNQWSVSSFDATRHSLLKLLQGLRMDAIVSFGIKSSPSQSITSFLDEEERQMHLLLFQRDVHPLLHKFRKATTFAGSSASGVTIGSGVINRNSQVLTGGANRRESTGRGSNGTSGKHASMRLDN